MSAVLLTKLKAEIGCASIIFEARQVQVMPKNLAKRTTGEKVGTAEPDQTLVDLQTDMASWRKYLICYFKTVPVVA